MQRLTTGLVLVAFIFVVTAIAQGMGSKRHDGHAMKAQVCYACDKCCTIEMKAGKCPKCGEDMKAMHLLAVKDGAAYCCTCGATCKCEMKGDDMTKCSCGMPVVKAPLKGKYVCSCGEACKCNTIADKPGKCCCGKDLKMVE